MNNQIMPVNRSAGFESQQGFGNEALYEDIHAWFLYESARYFELDTVAIEGNLISCKASAH